MTLIRDEENHKRFLALQADGICGDTAAWLADLDQRVRLSEERENLRFP